MLSRIAVISVSCLLRRLTQSSSAGDLNHHANRYRPAAGAYAPRGSLPSNADAALIVTGAPVTASVGSTSSAWTSLGFGVLADQVTRNPPSAGVIAWLLDFSPPSITMCGVPASPPPGSTS